MARYGGGRIGQGARNIDLVYWRLYILIRGDSIIVTGGSFFWCFTICTISVSPYLYSIYVTHFGGILAFHLKYIYFDLTYVRVLVSLTSAVYHVKSMALR